MKDRLLNSFIGNKENKVIAIVVGLAILLNVYNVEYIYGIKIFLTTLPMFFILKEFGSKKAFQASIVVYIVSVLLGRRYFTDIILPLQFLYFYFILEKKCKGKKVSLVLVDIIFWLLIGGPLNFLFYYLGNKGLDLGTIFIFFEVAKEIVVDLMNVLAVDLCFTYIPFIKKRRKHESSVLSIKEFSLHALLLALSIPFVLNICFYNVSEQNEQKNKANDVAKSISEKLTLEILGSENQKEDAQGGNSEGDKEQSANTEENKTQELENKKNDEKKSGWSEKDYMQLALNSELHKKKIDKVLDENPDYHRENNIIVIVDKYNKSIYRSDHKTGKVSFGAYYQNADKEYDKVGEFVPENFEKGIFKKTDWAGGNYIYKSKVEKPEWDIYIEINVQKFQENLIKENLRQVITLIIFAIFLVVTALFINKYIFRIISNLAQITLDIPDEINVIEKIKWPETTVLELNTLIENFKNMTIKLKYMFNKSNLLDEKLNISMEKLHKMAYYDTLTGLGNRHNFNEFLSRLLGNPMYEGSKVGVMFIDMDHFKEINDFLGHATGDILLQKISKRLKAIKKNDVEIFRLGGDEFVIVAITNDVKVLGEIGEQVLNMLHRPFLLKGGKYTLTGSIGVSIYPTDGDDIETITKYADMAMYNCKENGGDYVQFFNEDIKTNFLESVAIENGIRKGLVEGEFRLVFQPKISVSEKEVAGCEALLRWNSKELGCITPDKFIAIAEESELIVDIDRWVLKEACKKNKEIQELGLGYFQVSVNISPVHFAKGDLLIYVKEALKETGLSSKYLKLEITEGVFIHNSQDVINAINELNKIGVLVSIDDFGKGYSSLNEIMTLPIKEVKIDKHFVRDIFKDPKKRMVVKLIVELAHGFKLKVVAEGVETKEELQCIVETGCDEIQGYFFSKPLELEGLKSYLANKIAGFEFLRVMKKGEENE